MSPILLIFIGLICVCCKASHSLTNFTLINHPLLPVSGGEWHTYINDTTNEIWLLSPLSCNGSCHGLATVQSYSINTNKFTTHPSLPQELGNWGADCATNVGNIMYFVAAGGLFGTYNIETADWTLSLATMPIAVSSPCLTTDNRFIYIITGSATTHFQVYDLSQNEWLRNLGITPDSLTYGRSASTCEIYNGSIYIFGGTKSSTGIAEIETIYVGFDGDVLLNLNGISTWSILSQKLSVGRYGIGSTICRHIDQYYIYVIGGFEPGDTALQYDAGYIVEIFNTQTGTVETGPPLNIRRYGPSVSCVNNFIYVFGGQGPCPTDCQNAITYDTWEISNRLYTLDPTTSPISFENATTMPSTNPSNNPSNIPSIIPTEIPSSIPTDISTNTPTKYPSKIPTSTMIPTVDGSSTSTSPPFTIQPTLMSTVNTIQPTVSTTESSMSTSMYTLPDDDGSVDDVSTTISAENHNSDKNKNTNKNNLQIYIIIAVVTFILICCISLIVILFRRKKKKTNEKNNVTGYHLKANSVSPRNTFTTTNEFESDINPNPTHTSQFFHTTCTPNVNTLPSPPFPSSAHDGDMDIAIELENITAGGGFGGGINDIKHKTDAYVIGETDQVTNNGEQNKIGNDEFIINDHDQITIGGDINGDHDQITIGGDIDNIIPNKLNVGNDEFIISGNDIYLSNCDIAWNEYINVHNCEPSNPSQLLLVAKKSFKCKNLSFKEAKQTFNNNKGKWIVGKTNE